MARTAATLVRAISAAGIIVVAAAGVPPVVAAELATESAQASYALGLQIGRSIVDRGIPGVDPAAAAAGFADGINRAKPQLDDAALAATNGYFQREAARAGEQFLADNAKRDGVKTTASGLQYEVISEGTGAAPEPTSTVRVHYEGRLADGTVFDSSIERGEPAEFPLDGVIPGWSEGLQLMKTGAKYRLFMPPALGYGDRGVGGHIPPNAVLIFEVELLEIVAKPA